MYILTPSGITEKSRLTIRFAMRTWREYAKTLERLGESLNTLSETGAKKVLLLGANEVTDMVIEVIGEMEALEVVGIVDPNGDLDSRKGVQIIKSASSKVFDRAISCEQVGVEELVDKFGVTEEQLWLV